MKHAADNNIRETWLTSRITLTIWYISRDLTLICRISMFKYIDKDKTIIYKNQFIYLYIYAGYSQ
jgi:hypothetical protein